jgi:hypothetical protein
VRAIPGNAHEKRRAGRAKKCAGYQPKSNAPDLYRILQLPWPPGRLSHTPRSCPPALGARGKKLRFLVYAVLWCRHLLPPGLPLLLLPAAASRAGVHAHCTCTWRSPVPVPAPGTWHLALALTAPTCRHLHGTARAPPNPAPAHPQPIPYYPHSPVMAWPHDPAPGIQWQ